MDRRAGFQRAAFERLVKSWSSWRRGRATPARLLLAACLVGAAFSVSTSSDARERRGGRHGGGYSNSNNGFERAMREMQAEIDRQRREQDRQQRDMQRAMAEAQRAAEAEARRRQEEMERDMRREQERAMREAQRQQEQAQREQQQRVRDAERENATEQTRWGGDDERRRLQRQQDEDGRSNTARRDDADIDYDIDADPGLDPAQRRAKALEAETRRLGDKLARDQARQRKDDEDRSRRDRERQTQKGDSVRGPAAPVMMQEPTQTPSAKTPNDIRAPNIKTPPVDRSAGNKDEGPRTPRAAPVAPPVPVSYPGKDKGAELPADLFAKSREGEFIVPALSPADVDKLKQRGFEVSEPTSAGGKAAVQRVRGSGYDPNEAERELHKALQTSVMQNHAYSIFLGSLGESDPGGADKRAVVPATSQPCPDSVCFGRKFINWSKAAGACAKTAKIGIIDTSFDTKHPAFTNLKATSRAFLDKEKPSPYDWHGTAVLSLLAGNPDSSTPGLAPDAQYLLATAFRSDVTGNASTDTVRLLSALSWLEESNVDIVNMSFSGPQDPAIAQAIARMSKKGIVFVAAAGNMGPTAPPSYPAAYPQVIAVTAVNRQGNNYSKANRGSHIDVSAPGVDIVTALPKAQQGYKTGTSFAAPFVTAILATQGDLGFTGAKAKVLSHLPTRDLGPPGRDPMYGSGLATAPPVCGDGTVVAADDTVPVLPPVQAAHEAWGAKTTLMRAGAGP